MSTPPPMNSKINLFKSASHIIHNSPNKEPFKGMLGKAIVQSINAALIALQEKVDRKPVRVQGAMLLKSGDFHINMDNCLMKNWLVEDKHVWLTISHKDFEMAQTKHPVLFNYVPADSGKS
ncbi:hypothetical protein CROQUDRAFT_130712 [Cronartium quercuum f. sp. fusiforme G11]|uniref:Uncharacterized protein n=1 Tax=Cronartium quercuum f. sp. fusiforme G11 TaxID=708437 RepID=A0A9P6TF68_9BASI|nr:hypothetical protein CROQUDRAFT_130712 [Cronartium quercuum f. sp. fusiforme G11]